MRHVEGGKRHVNDETDDIRCHRYKRTGGDRRVDLRTTHHEREKRPDERGNEYDGEKSREKKKPEPDIPLPEGNDSKKKRPEHDTIEGRDL